MKLNFNILKSISKLGEVIIQYCKKGQRIGIEGTLQKRSRKGSFGKMRTHPIQRTKKETILSIYKKMHRPRKQNMTGYVK